MFGRRLAFDRLVQVALEKSVDTVYLAGCRCSIL